MFVSSVNAFTTFSLHAFYPERCPSLYTCYNTCQMQGIFLLYCILVHQHIPQYRQRASSHGPSGFDFMSTRASLWNCLYHVILFKPASLLLRYITSLPSSLTSRPLWTWHSYHVRLLYHTRNLATRGISSSAWSFTKQWRISLVNLSHTGWAGCSKHYRARSTCTLQRRPLGLGPDGLIPVLH